MSGRVALMTGGAGGIGGAIAGAPAAAGHRVATLDREGDIACDLAREDDCAAQRWSCWSASATVTCSCGGTAGITVNAVAAGLTRTPTAEAGVPAEA